VTDVAVAGDMTAELAEKLFCVVRGRACPVIAETALFTGQT
jgi:hypothetical protein